MMQQCKQVCVVAPECKGCDGQPPQPPPQLAQWQADRICTAAGAGSPLALEAALRAVGVPVDSETLATPAAMPDEATAAATMVIVNCRDSERCLTPLHWAAGGSTTVDGNDSSVFDTDGSGAGACAAILLARGANPNARDAHGSTPLHYAARYRSLVVCQQLLACRATRLDLRNAWGRTALMFTTWGGDDCGGSGGGVSVGVGGGGCEQCRAELARALLAAGASVDIRDSRGRTALMWAALTGKTSLVRLLLAAGADWRRRNLDGRTAGQLAEREGHTEVARLLAAVAEEALKAPPKAASPTLPGPEGAATPGGGAPGGSADVATGT